jgi:hypothetical protein
MIPGPDQIIACPDCMGLARYMTLVSGNTFGARVWTDGKQVAPMLPRPPAVVKCSHCAECYWLTDAEEIGTVDRWQGEGQQVDPAWADAQKVKEPTEDEYYQTIEKALVNNAEQERDLRVLAWWRRTDPFRDYPPPPPQGVSSAPRPWRENLEALSRLLTGEDDHGRLMKAEVLRELGEFTASKETLSLVSSPKFAAVTGQMRSLCDTQDTCVRELHLAA